MTSSATLALNVTGFFETLPKDWTSKIATGTTGEASAGGIFQATDSPGGIFNYSRFVRLNASESRALFCARARSHS